MDCKNFSKLLIKLSFLALISFVGFQQCLAQYTEISFTHIGREQGLINNTTRTIFQDTRGFMWFGTSSGLNRYDGYRFYDYLKGKDKSKSLNSNTINKFFEDKKKRLWIATANGLSLYQPDKDQFKTFTNSKIFGNSSADFINDLQEDNSGNILLGTATGLVKFNPTNGQFFINKNRFQSTKKNVATAIICFYSYSPDLLMIGTERSGLELFDTKLNKYISFGKKNDQLNRLNGTKIVQICKDLQGNIWIATYGKGVFVFNPKLNTLKNFKLNKSPISLSGDDVLSVLCDHKGNVWIGIENGGLNLWQPKTESFIRYQNDLRKSSSLSQKTVIYVYEDRQDNIWVAAQKGGLNIYSPNSSIFKTYISETWEGALSYKDVKAFYELPSGEILIGTDGGGLNLWNRKADKFEHFRHNPDVNSSISSDYVISISRDKKGRIWIGTWGGGLNQFDISTGKFIRYSVCQSNSKNLDANKIMSIHPDENGLIWIATYGGGLNLFDPENGTFKRITASADGKTSFTAKMILTTYEDKERNLWFGAEDSGISYLEADRSDFNILPVYDIHTLFNDSKNRLWGGKTGLYLCEQKENKFIQFKTSTVIDHLKIHSIEEDNSGNLWISTLSGLFQYNPDTKFFKSYKKENGLQGLEFNLNSSLKTKSGDLIFGGTQGFNVLYAGKSKTKDFSYPVYITDLQIFNKSIEANPKSKILKRNITYAKEIVLDYDQSVFSLDYAALNYATASSTQYAYFLEGFDKNWNNVGSQRKAIYTNLDPGRYKFYVKARTVDGFWNSMPTSIIIVIEPAFWMTWWFKTIVILLTLAVIFSILYYRRKKELELFHNQKRVELQQLQLQFFINISHEFRTPLSLILGTLEQILKQDIGSIFTRHYQTINRNAYRLLNLISELMDFRKAETNVLKLKIMQANFGLFLEEINEDFEELAIMNDIDFKISKPNLGNVYFDRQVVEKIVLNLLNNAFKFTPKDGSIRVTILESLETFKPDYKEGYLEILNDYKGKSYLHLSISDTGVGISKNNLQHMFEPYYRFSDHLAGTGIGLAFVKSLTFLHKGSIRVYSEHKKGTQIIISMPCAKEDFSLQELEDKQAYANGARLESIILNDFSVINEPGIPNNTTANKPLKRKETILIVEDNVELRLYLKEVLESYYTIYEAKNGAEGTEIVKNHSLSLIISDLMMPIMDGVEFCKIIKDDFETSHIPFILLTAKYGLESSIEGLESGADYYFSKPVSADLLLLTIKNLFKQRYKLKERYLKDYQVQAHDLVHSSKDKAFLNQLISIIEEKLEDPELNIDYIIKKLGTSKTPLSKKIKGVTGQSMIEFIRSFRLKKAMEIMTNEDVLISEVIYRVGILSQSYFSNIFKKEFGITPSQFQQQLDKNRKDKLLNI
ncbi:two-component regulator propeller domain-containing protein [Pedobacter jamesrossensis]|uniref:two-component regulator propeller domain-containing protein n=1 Tax=Pedobacter jamesrossensis TaxID=1908238 RepID=UPI00360729BA